MACEVAVYSRLGVKVLQRPGFKDAMGYSARGGTKSFAAGAARRKFAGSKGLLVFTP